MSKKIISYCLWGDNPKYTIGALKNADLALEIYPDWICRYYVGKSTPCTIINDLINKSNTEVFVMSEEGDWSGMFWRFFPASEPDVEVMISRDTDSRLGEREKAAVDEWLASGNRFHIMRDHPLHLTEILGGMWGVRANTIPMQLLIKNFEKGDFWQVDQKFLKKEIYPTVDKNDLCFVHDEFFEKKPFPTPRPAGIEKGKYPIHYVGKAYDENDNPC